MSLSRGPISEVRIDMLRRVWRCQMSRHGGLDASRTFFFTNDIATGPRLTKVPVTAAYRGWITDASGVSSWSGLCNCTITEMDISSGAHQLPAKITGSHSIRLGWAFCGSVS